MEKDKNLPLHIPRQVRVDRQAEARVAKLADIAEVYELFEDKLDGVIKVAVEA